MKLLLLILLCASSVQAFDLCAIRSIDGKTQFVFELPNELNEKISHEHRLLFENLNNTTRDASFPHQSYYFEATSYYCNVNDGIVVDVDFYDRDMVRFQHVFYETPADQHIRVILYRNYVHIKTKFNLPGNLICRAQAWRLMSTHKKQRAEIVFGVSYFAYDWRQPEHVYVIPRGRSLEQSYLDKQTYLAAVDSVQPGEVRNDLYLDEVERIFQCGTFSVYELSKRAQKECGELSRDRYAQQICKTTSDYKADQAGKIFGYGLLAVISAGTVTFMVAFARKIYYAIAR